TEWDKKKVLATHNFKHGVSVNKLYENYQIFCHASGYMSHSKIRFGKILKDNFVEIKSGTRNGERVWENIGLIRKKNQ
ncbi:MAG: hypothetical protein K8I00_12725, partial [Candidatus Omnitrophica bacterium]|nr:hypothetical protein [Candidatus Omnitrophota bacterium]